MIATIVKIFVAPSIPTTGPLIYVCILYLFVCGARFVVRAILRAYRGRDKIGVAVYGLGSAGVQTIQSLISSHDYVVRMIIDDDPRLHGQKVFGKKVRSLPQALEELDRTEIQIVLLSMPSVHLKLRNQR